MVSAHNCLIISPTLIIRLGKALDYESRDSQFDPVCVQKLFFWISLQHETGETLCDFTP